MTKPIEGLPTDAGYAQDVFGAPEPPLFSLLDDCLRAGRADAREPNELLGSSLVDIDPWVLLDTRGALIRARRVRIRERECRQSAENQR
jgi:hypothetical protein